jgi:ADP-heptose:LPS heptosyltransferase
MEEFVALARELESRGRSVTWSLGPAEEQMRVSGMASVIHPATPVMMARELAAARLYIGNDSGVTHLAAAIGCKTVAVFGPTDPKVWAPRGPNMTAVQGNPWPCLDLVLTAALGA